MTKRTAKNKLFYSVLLLVVSLITTVSVVFGWFVIGDPDAQSFVVNVTGISGDVGLKINNINYGGANLVLENALPQSQYLFELAVTPSHSGNVRLTLKNIEGAFYDEASEQYGDMSDVFAVRYPKDVESFTLLSGYTDYVITSSVAAAQGVPVSIEFLLFFNDASPEGVDINIYQGKTLFIEKLLIEII
ncbi:MAG: hypothetical protein PHC84_04300 [Clostridia bacterium]|nr:hypothetical protein [Clostridia bacterium]